MPSFKIIGILVQEKKIVKGVYHIWAWRPSWSCDLDHCLLPKEPQHESNRKTMNRNWSNQKANPALKTKRQIPLLKFGFDWSSGAREGTFEIMDDDGLVKNARP